MSQTQKKYYSLSERAKESFELRVEKSLNALEQAKEIITKTTLARVIDKEIVRALPEFNKDFSWPTLLGHFWGVTDLAEEFIFERLYKWARPSDFLEIILSTGKAPYRAAKRHLQYMGFDMVQIKRFLMSNQPGLAEKMVDQKLSPVHFTWELASCDFDREDIAIQNQVRKIVLGGARI